MRKSFAVLLLGSWISLSGFDSLEAGNLTAPIDLQLSGDAKSHSQHDFPNDLLDSPDVTVSCQPAIYEGADSLLSPDRFAVEHKGGKIYKVLRVLLL